MSRSLDAVLRNTKRAALVTAIVGALVTLPAASQHAKTPKTQLWLDVATHSMAGMPDMSGGMGGMAMRMFGGDAMQNHYGSARHAGMPGRYVDVALLNQLNPGKEAVDEIPAGMQLGKTLPLLPPKAEKAVAGGTPTRGMADGNAKARILIYWGCGTTVRPGQPKELKFEVKDGKVIGDASAWGKAMQGRYAPDRTVDVGPQYALWPNEKHRKMVPKGGSLVGNHRITGEKIPASLQFDLTQQQDFMPEIALTSTGDLATSGQTFKWPAVDRAKGYFLHAMGTQDDAMVFWSSSEIADAGMGIFDYLPPPTVEKWVGEKVLLAPSVTTCAIPKGIFAGKEGGSGGVLQMIAFGPESHITYPPKPADPKAAAAWTPEWNVRVRNKSTATAMLGMSIDATQAEQQDPQKPEESKAKRLLKGILGR